MTVNQTNIYVRTKDGCVTAIEPKYLHSFEGPPLEVITKAEFMQATEGLAELIVGKYIALQSASKK